MEVARTLAAALRPDYLSVIAEPDTEGIAVAQARARHAGGQPRAARRDPGRSAGSARAGCRHRGRRRHLAARAIASSSRALPPPSIDFVDMHLYPVDRAAILPRAVEIADIAASYGKQVGMTETWLYKVNEAESGLLSRFHDLQARCLQLLGAARRLSPADDDGARAFQAVCVHVAVLVGLSSRLRRLQRFDEGPERGRSWTQLGQARWRRTC